MTIRKDIEEIYNLRQFKDIQVETENVPDGVAVIFKVVEIPSIGDLKLWAMIELTLKISVR